jgi:ferredoxin-NADP reductase
VEEGHLHVRDLGDLTDTDIFMCGPKRLTEDFRRQLRGRGVPEARIHFEDFEFR